jgi:prefoldin alpha subunit
LNMLEQQIRQVQQQLQAVGSGINELEVLNEGLNEIPGSEGKEILAQIGRGIFIKAKVLSEELIVDIGKKNFVRKSAPETKKLIEEQIGKLRDVEKELEENLENLNRDFSGIISEYQKTN